MAETQGTPRRGERSSYSGLWGQQHSRRRILQAGALGGAGLMASALIGCSSGKKAAAPAATAAAKSTAAAAGATAAAAQPKRGGQMVTTLTEDPAHWNAYISIQFPMLQMFDAMRARVVKYDSGVDVNPTDLKIVPDLAEKWEQTDATTLALHFRPGVKWHDGVDFTSEDVAASILAQRDNKANQFGYHFDWVSGVTTPDAKTAIIKTIKPFGPLLPNLAQRYSSIAPKAVVAKGDDALKANAIGTGPWMLKESTKGIRYTLTRNPNYFVKDLPYADELAYLIMPDANANQAAYISGQLSVTLLGSSGAGPGTKVNSDAVTARTKDNVEKYSAGEWQALALNMAKKPLEDKRVRQAISLSIDRPAINQLVKQGEGYITGAVPATLGAFAAKDPLNELPNLKRDVAKAKQLLAAAGFGSGFELEIEFSQGQINNRDTTALLQQQLAEAGIKVKVNPMEHVAHLAYFASGGFTAVSRSNTAYQDPDDYVWAFFNTKGTRRNGGWGSAALDAVLEKQRQATDVKARAELVMEAQKMILDEAYYPPLVDGPIYYHWQSKLKNFRPHAAGADNQFQRAWIEG